MRLRFCRVDPDDVRVGRLPHADNHIVDGIRFILCRRNSRHSYITNGKKEGEFL